MNALAVDRKAWLRVIAGLILFGISFGYVEAAVVVYLRTMIEPIRREIDPARSSGELFPIITEQQLLAKAPEATRLRATEGVREAATLVMLAAVAWAATGAGAGWLPCFAIAFGTWDIFFYVFLKVLIGWPASLLTWDILFLIPVPWVSPVLAPVLVSLSIIFGGFVALRRPVRATGMHWMLMTLGCALILASFMWDFQNIVAGGRPHPFLWGLFAAGEVVGLGGFLHAARAPRVDRIVGAAAAS